MAFVTGLLLIEAPASALNNLGNIPGARTDNTVGVKMIRTPQGAYPYVSAQAFRYWLRATLGDGGDNGGRQPHLPRTEGGLYRRQPNPLVGRRSLRLHARAVEKKVGRRCP